MNIKLLFLALAACTAVVHAADTPAATPARRARQ